MVQKELSDYILLQDIFQRRCEEICEMLTPLNDSYRYLSDFEISSDPDEIAKRGQAKEAERLRNKKLQEEAQEKRDREEYERLKKKFESN